MKKEGTQIFVDIKTRKIVKLEAAKRDITMKKLVHDAVIEYLKRHKIEVNDLTPEEDLRERKEDIYTSQRQSKQITLEDVINEEKPNA